MSTSEHGPADGQTPRTIIAVMAGAGSLVAFSVVGYLVFEEPTYGVMAGLFSGTGTFLLVKYIMTGALAEEDAGTDSLGGHSHDSGGLHGGAAGFSLDAAGVVVLAVGFADGPNLPLGLGAGIAFALVGYVVLERVLPEPPTR